MEVIFCYICSNATTDFVNIQDEYAHASGKPFKELIEYISGITVELPDILCQSCVTKLNHFDEFSLKATQIQNELKIMMSTKFYIKEEPIENCDNVSIGSYETEMNTDVENEVELAVALKSPREQKIINETFLWNITIPQQHVQSIPKSRKPKKSQKIRPAKGMKSEIFLCTFESCDRRFESLKRLQHHLQLHSTERPFQCSFCGKFYKTRDCLRSHQRVVHRNADLRVICDTCGLAFTRKPSLERHYKAAHLKLRTFVCQLCGAAYCNASSLQAHSFVHDKDNKNFACHICEARFHTKSKLTRHMRCHSEKEYECPICQRKYSQRYNLTAHMKQAHVEYQILKEQSKPIVCQLCGRIFDRKTALNKHLRNVHEAVPISKSLE